MHFKIIGTEHATSARRVVELDAPNRAAAEKQAHLQGVDYILHVEQVTDDEASAGQAHVPPRATHRGEWPRSSHRAKWIAAAAAAVLAGVAAAWWLR